MSNETLHVYTRVSSDQQEDNTSLENQRVKGEELAGRLGFDVRVWNEGVGSSSRDTLDNRPVISELVGQVRDGLVKHLYVEYIDRLSRNQRTWGTIRLLLEENNVLLYTGSDISPTDISNPQDNFLLGIMSEIAQFDNKVRTQRLYTGKFNRIKQGNWGGGPAPYGYKIEDKKLVVDEIQQKGVELIFREFLRTKSSDQVRKILMEKGFVTNRGKNYWSKGSVEQVLRNTHHNGSYQITQHKTGEVFTCDCPRTIDPRLYDEVTKLREERSYGKRLHQSNQKHIFTLTDLLVCGSCGTKMSPSNVTRNFEYRCLSKLKNHRLPDEDKIHCENKNGLTGEVVEEQVWLKVLEVLNKSHLFKELIKQDITEKKITKKQSTEQVKKLQTSIKSREKKIKDYTEVIANLTAMKLVGEGTEDIEATLTTLQDKREKLRSEVREFEYEISNLSSSSKWVDWVKEFSTMVNDLTEQTDNKKRNEFLKPIVENIVVSKNEDTGKYQTLSINFVLPFVDDKFEWNDTKRKEYTLTKGVNKIDLVVDSFRKKSSETIS